MSLDVCPHRVLRVLFRQHISSRAQPFFHYTQSFTRRDPLIKAIMKATGADRYNPNMIGELERSVADQVGKGSVYDFATSLALVRFYVITPDRVNTKLLSQILIKAMMRLPEADFATILHLVPERLQEEQPIAALIALTQHLEGARFQSFWLAVDSCRDVLNSVPGFYDAIRQYILGVINSTAQIVAKSTLAEYLRFDGDAVDQLIAQKTQSEGWSEITGGENGKAYIKLPKTNHNVIKEVASQGGFRFEQLAPLLAAK